MTSKIAFGFLILVLLSGCTQSYEKSSTAEKTQLTPPIQQETTNPAPPIPTPDQIDSTSPVSSSSNEDDEFSDGLDEAVHDLEEAYS